MEVDQKILLMSKAQPTGCVTWSGILRRGYPALMVGRRFLPVHRYVLEKKLGRKLTGLACHTCDNSSCIKLEHLYEGSHHDNVGDMISRGRVRYLHGESHPQCKLTAEDVEIIRFLLENKVLQKTIAGLMGVKPSQVSRINTGRQRRIA